MTILVVSLFQKKKNVPRFCDPEDRCRSKPRITSDIAPKQRKKKKKYEGVRKREKIEEKLEAKIEHVKKDTNSKELTMLKAGKN